MSLAGIFRRPLPDYLGELSSVPQVLFVSSSLLVVDELRLDSLCLEGGYIPVSGSVSSSLLVADELASKAPMIPTKDLRA